MYLWLNVYGMIANDQSSFFQDWIENSNLSNLTDFVWQFKLDSDSPIFSQWIIKMIFILHRHCKQLKHFFIVASVDKHNEEFENQAEQEISTEFKKHAFHFRYDLGVCFRRRRGNFSISILCLSTNFLSKRLTIHVQSL